MCLFTEIVIKDAFLCIFDVCALRTCTTYVLRHLFRMICMLIDLKDSLIGAWIILICIIIKIQSYKNNIDRMTVKITAFRNTCTLHACACTYNNVEIVRLENKKVLNWSESVCQSRLPHELLFIPD